MIAENPMSESDKEVIIHTLNPYAMIEVIKGHAQPYSRIKTSTLRMKRGSLINGPYVCTTIRISKDSRSWMIMINFWCAHGIGTGPI